MHVSPCLSACQVDSWSQLRQLLALGCAARTEADTLENIKSSRGHAILTLEVHSMEGKSYALLSYRGQAKDGYMDRGADRSLDPF